MSRSQYKSLTIPEGLYRELEKFVAAVKEGAQILGMSALITTTIANMGKTVEELRKAGIREKVKVIVGGAPLYPEYATKLGADGYGEKASDAINLVKEFVEKEERGE